MKKIILVVVVLCTSLLSKTQDLKIYRPIDVTVKATYKTGTGDLMTYVSSNFKQPIMCVLDKVKTSLRMRFVINEDGSISNITVSGCESEGICCEDISAACEDMLKQMKDWTPAQIDGVKVKQWGEIPLNINNAG